MINAAVANKTAEGISQSTAGADLLAKSSGGASALKCKNSDAANKLRESITRLYDKHDMHTSGYPHQVTREVT